jgi:hypothetical protein
MHFNPEFEDSTVLYAGIQPPHYTVKQCTKPQFLPSLPRKLQIYFKYFYIIANSELQVPLSQNTC